MSGVRLFCFFVAALLWPGHATALPRNLVVLVSIDGFRADYLDLGHTPTLARLAKDGAVADGLKPPFPSLTFPSHVSIVTGRPPDRHGIVHNSMSDPAIRDQRFTLASREAVSDARWWREAVPIWVTAARGRKTTSTMFWPGSETAIGGIRPMDWLPYDDAISSADRVARLLKWLERPDRADFATLYFSEVDTAGHFFGPQSPEVATALKSVDSALATFLEGLERLGLAGAADVVIVSDHGMAEASLDRIIDVRPELKRFPSARGEWADAIGGFTVSAEEEAPLLAALQERAHMRCWRKTDVPAAFAFGSNPRVPPLVCVADLGWRITYVDTPRRMAGLHGYDPKEPSMWGLFVAHGPRIRQVRVPVTDNLDVYLVLCRLLEITPELNEANSLLSEQVLK